MIGSKTSQLDSSYSKGINTFDYWQVLLKLKGVRVSSYSGQVKKWEYPKNLESKNAITRVEKKPPINPSQVFLGDNSVSLVLPNKLPKIYAKISFAITSNAGKMNQQIPSYILFRIEDIYPKINKRAIWVQPNC